MRRLHYSHGGCQLQHVGWLRMWSQLQNVLWRGARGLAVAVAAAALAVATAALAVAAITLTLAGAAAI